MTRPHGYARYKLDGCRCYVCGHAQHLYNTARTRAIAYGTWNPWTPAAPARTHIHALSEAGIGIRRLAALTGLSRSALQAIAGTGRPAVNKVRPATAAKILAVEATLDTIAPSTPVDATGTRRRLQALVRVGWAQAQLAARLGVSPGNFGAILTRDQVTAAADRRWPPPAAWDDDEIDDPAARPTGARRTAA